VNTMPDGSHWTIAKLVEATRGTLLQGDPNQRMGMVSTDTRQLRPADCFVALVGEHSDGHAFIPDALTKGANALVVSSKRPDRSLPAPAGVAVIEVSDTLFALGEIACYFRLQHPIPVVGITGSNGKTSTKETVSVILGQNYEVLKNKGNYNNLIGVPLTLLSLQPQHQVAVVEMGINVPGEMARLVEISKPTVGLITNVQPAHLEGLHSLDEIVREKGKLWLSLHPDELAVVNLDDRRLAEFSKNTSARMVTYSLHAAEAHVRLAGEVTTQDGVSAFDVALGDQVISVRLPVLGLHHVGNTLAAVAVGWGMGLTADLIAAGLARYEPVRMRMQMHRLADGRVLIDDTYNANPGSLLAAVRTVALESRGKPVVAVLGDMRELGPESAVLHREVGRRIAALGVAQLITLGEMTQELAGGAREAGIKASACRHADSHHQIVEWLKNEIVKDAWILVKGSRSMAMDRVVEGILSG
jgi:UDP-N-acetylmuramoyl-tripeptide--D-alanyl-D-alanine ligase